MFGFFDFFQFVNKFWIAFTKLTNFLCLFSSIGNNSKLIVFIYNYFISNVENAAKSEIKKNLFSITGTAFVKDWLSTAQRVARAHWKMALGCRIVSNTFWAHAHAHALGLAGGVSDGVCRLALTADNLVFQCVVFVSCGWLWVHMSQFLFFRVQFLRQRYYQ